MKFIFVIFTIFFFCSVKANEIKSIVQIDSYSITNFDLIKEISLFTEENCLIFEKIKKDLINSEHVPNIESLDIDNLDDFNLVNSIAKNFYKKN